MLALKRLWDLLEQRWWVWLVSICTYEDFYPLWFYYPSGFRVAISQLQWALVFSDFYQFTLNFSHLVLSQRRLIILWVPRSNTLISSLQLVSFCPKVAISSLPSVILASVPSPGRSAGSFALSHSAAIVQPRPF